MKKLGRIVFIVLVFAVCVAALWGCSQTPEQSSARVSNIVLEKSEAYIASYGENTTFQIYPAVYPETATNKKVVFRLKSIQDAAFVSVNDNGLVKGVRPKEDGTPVEIIVKSVDNPKITASMFVYVEDKPVERIYFSPRKTEVYIDQEPFTVKANYLPAHAAEGTVITYTSDNPAVAEVEPTSGLVTVVSRGTANIVASNVNGVKDFLELKVLMTPPLYLLEEITSSESAYNQVPGIPQTITYTLVPGLNNDPNCRIRWYAESTEVVTNRDKLTFEYTPSADLLPSVYNVEVEVRDTDDQIQRIKSRDINVYYEFTGAEGIQIDLSKEYFVSDRINVKPILNEVQQRPESYIWYYRRLIGTEKEETLSDYTQYQQVGRSYYANDGGSYAFYPANAGTLVIAMVPVVNDVPQYDALMHTGKITVNLLENGNPYYNVTFSTVKENNDTLLKLDWGYMPGESEFVVEINQNGTPSFLSSDDARYAAYFTETSVTIPSSVHPVTSSATFRLRTSRFGFGEEYEYRAGTLNTNSELLRFNKPVEGLPFDYYAKSMSDVGDIFNYIRFFRPGQGNYAAEAEGIRYFYEGGASDGYLHGFTFDLAFGFDFDDVDKTKYDKTNSPFDRISSYYVGDKDLPGTANATERAQFAYFKTDYNELIDKVFAAFLAYGESGRSGIEVRPQYVGTKGSSLTIGSKGTFSMPMSDTQAYYATITVYLKDEPDASTLKSDKTKEKGKELRGYVPLISSSPRGEGYDEYFKNSIGEMPVWNGQQLYLAAVWGYKPVPSEGSVADTILGKAKGILNSVLGSDLVTQRDKLKAIHDYIVVNISYDYDLASKNDADSLSYGYCLEGVFFEKYAVCDGLSKAFALFGWMEGIVTLKISGVTAGGAGHAWNNVLVDGEWRLVDTTWDSTDSPSDSPNVNIPTSMFFLKTEKDSGFREGIDRRSYGEYPSAK